MNKGQQKKNSLFFLNNNYLKKKKKNNAKSYFMLVFSQLFYEFEKENIMPLHKTYYTCLSLPICNENLKFICISLDNN